MSNPALWGLLFGNFCIGTGVMVVPGALNEISGSLSVSPAVAGQLISAGAVLMCFGAPAFAAIVAGWDRRRLLALSMVWFAALHALSAMMPSFAALLPVRVLTLVSPAVFTPQAAACVGLLVPPDRRPQAVTFVFLGWSLASVLGAPLGSWVAGHWGWQSAFVVVAGLSTIAAIAVWITMPDGIRPPALSRQAWASVLGDPLLMGIVAVTALQAVGQFALFSYMAPVVREQIGADANTLSLIWLWFGVCGLVGNLVVARNIGRIGPARAALGMMALMATSLFIWPLGSNLVLLLVIVTPWGLGCFAANSAQQARLVAIAPGLASGSVALNTAAIYLGQAVGAGSGGWLLSHELPILLSIGGGFVMLVAMALSHALARRESCASSGSDASRRTQAGAPTSS